MSTKTFEALLAQHQKKFVPLETIAAEYLGVTDKKTLSKMAHKNDLGGIKAFKVRGNGSPWLVDLEQLAKVLDEKAK